MPITLLQLQQYDYSKWYTSWHLIHKKDYLRGQLRVSSGFTWMMFSVRVSEKVLYYIMANGIYVLRTKNCQVWHSCMKLFWKLNAMLALSNFSSKALTWINLVGTWREQKLTKNSRLYVNFGEIFLVGTYLSVHPGIVKYYQNSRSWVSFVQVYLNKLLTTIATLGGPRSASAHNVSAAYRQLALFVCLPGP